MKVEDTHLSKGQVNSYMSTRRDMQKISIFRIWLEFMIYYKTGDRPMLQEKKKNFPN